VAADPRRKAHSTERIGRFRKHAEPRVHAGRGAGIMGPMADRPVPTVEELKLKLTPMQFHVTQEAGTERAFSGEYWDTKDPGTYECVVCGEELFDSDTKYDSHCGWPSFYDALDTDKIEYVEDRSHGMVRTEVRCKNCGAHLGHIFPDGPAPTGQRYCINSASINLDRR